MNVLLVSQCSGHALPETRRILDQFAERRGERTWQTSVTEQGLEAIRRLLNKTARRNSAVACHWIRGRDHSELVWIVGNAGRFNAEGAVPTNTTTADVRRTHHENDWHNGEVIRLLAKLAALFHDVGKANEAFQKKLSSSMPVRDAYRHEWVSLRMFMAFVGAAPDDNDWLARLAGLQPEKEPVWMQCIVSETGGDTPKAFDLPACPLAQMVGWLVVSHHFLPAPFKKLDNTKQLGILPRIIAAEWNRADPAAGNPATCWSFPKGTPFASVSWCEDVRRVAQGMQRHRKLLGENWLHNPYVAHLARLSLMLADHHYSGQPADPSRGDRRFALYANTERGPDGKSQLRQRLDEHLLGVAYHAGYVARQLPRMERDLPRIARHKGFTRRSEDRRFGWQDRAYDLACSLRQKAADNGFFGVNMASTGCGKTLANGRILYALADPQRGARFTIALGLRTLTLQTGDVYRKRLKLGADVLAVRVGGAGVRELFEYGRDLSAQQAASQAPDAAQKSGSESGSSLTSPDSHVHYEGSLPDGPLKAWLSNSPGALPLVNAPILVSTIDHLIPATEGTRGGQQIAPMLRLMTSDLVLDEPDDFDIDDLPALSRLVHWAGMLGSRVLLSSATLPPALIQGLFEAYRHGRSIYQRNRGVGSGTPVVACAWFDEHFVEPADCADAASFVAAHKTFVDKRLHKLAGAKLRRQAEIHELGIAKAVSQKDRAQLPSLWAQALQVPMQTLHQRHHSVDAKTGKRVSFGLIRMANIDPLIDTAVQLFAHGAPQGQRIHLCCYHSQHPLAVRAAIERTLDACLDRHADNADKAEVTFKQPELRRLLDTHPEPDQIFIVLATAVAEVGRDHDYDWAIVEPSSMRSIIQLAGRVMRHRERPCTVPNIVLLGHNLKSLRAGNEAAYLRPGFEHTNADSPCRLASHRLADILLPEQYSHIDAAPRIRERVGLKAKTNLVDLEHQRLQFRMLGGDPGEPWTAALWWAQPAAHLTAVLQRRHPFRYQRTPKIRHILMPDEDTSSFAFMRQQTDGGLTHADARLHRMSLACGERIQAWGTVDLLSEIASLADAMDVSPTLAALRYAGVDLPDDKDEGGQGWRYQADLGFGRNFRVGV